MSFTRGPQPAPLCEPRPSVVRWLGIDRHAAVDVEGEAVRPALRQSTEEWMDSADRSRLLRFVGGSRPSGGSVGMPSVPGRRARAGLPERLTQPGRSPELSYGVPLLPARAPDDSRGSGASRA